VSKRPADVDPRRLQGIPRVRWLHATETSNYNDAEDACFLAGCYGLVPDPWQVEIINSWLVRRPRGAWVHKRNGLAVPRQNGKNGALEVRELYGLIELGEAILHTSHQIKTSRKAFKRLKEFFGEKRDDPDAKHPELNALVAEVRNTNGQEAIVLKDVWRVDGKLVRSVGRPLLGAVVEHVARGGFIEFATRTSRGGRGTTYDLLVVDEAQHLSEEDLEAIRPVISSAPLGNSQIIYLGTPPDPEKLDAKIGEAWVRIRKGANKAKDLGWIEYGVPDGPMPDIDDLELLYQANPALEVRHGNGSFGLDLETVQGEKAELTPAGYARERYGWWGNPDAGAHRGVIQMDQWKTLRDAGMQIPTRATIVVDCHPDLLWTTVAIATAAADGQPLGMVDRHEGTAWLPWRIKQLVDDLEQVVQVPAKDDPDKKTAGVALTPSAAHFGPLLSALEKPIAYHLLTSTELGDACMASQQMIHDRAVHHVGQPTLDIAARNAITRYSGEVQQWDRRQNKTTDISPIVAWSVAVTRWRRAAAVKAPPVAPPTRGSRRDAATTRTSTKTPAPTTSRTTADVPRRRGRGTTAAGFDPRTSGF
jgi:hypothetical protein